MKSTNACAASTDRDSIYNYEPQSIVREPVFQAYTGKALNPVADLQPGSVLGMAFSENGKSLVALYRYTDTYRLLIEWDLESGKETGRSYGFMNLLPYVATDHGFIAAQANGMPQSYEADTSMAWPTAAIVSADGSKRALFRQLVYEHARNVMSMDAIDICDTASDELLWRVPFGTTDTAIALSNDGKVLVTSIPAYEGRTRQTFVWQRDGSSTPVVFDGGPPFALSSDGTKLTYRLPNPGSFAILNLRDGRRTIPEVDAPHFPNADAFMFSPDGKKLMSFASDSIDFWDAETGKYLQHTGQYGGKIFPPDPVHINAAWSRDGKTVALAKGSGIVLFHADKQKGLVRRITGNSGRITSISLSEDRHLLLTGDESGNASVWDTENWTAIRVMHTSTPVDAVAISADGRRLAIRDRSGHIVISSAKGGADYGKLPGIEAGAAPGCGGMAFSRDGTLLASCGPGKVLVWPNTADRKPPRELENKPHSFQQLAFSPDSRTLVANEPGSLGYARHWNLSDGTVALTNYPWPDCCASIVFSPDGIHIALGGDNALYLVQKTSGEQAHALNFANGYDEFVRAVDFSADGKTLLAYSGDRRQFEYWDVKSETRSALHLPMVNLYSVRLLRDGRRIVGLDRNGEVEVFDPSPIPGDNTVRWLAPREVGEATSPASH